MATDKKISYEMQGGMKNYLGKQKMVKAPLHWQSGPKHPKTELAYITKKEKDLILKKNLHGSLAKGANEGPSGIMSLNSQGDRGTYGKAGQSHGDQERPGQSSTPSGKGSHHPGVGPTKTTTRTVSPKDHFEQSWTGNPVFGGLFGGGYRDLKVAGDTSQGHKSRWGGLGRGLLSLFGGIPGKVFSTLSSLKSLPKHKTLSSWWGGLKQPEEEEEFTGTMPEGYHYNQQGKLTYNAPRPDMLGDYGFKSSVVGTPKRTDVNDLDGVNFNKNTVGVPNENFTNFDQNTGTWYADGGRAGYAFGKGPVLDVQEDENIIDFMQDQNIPHGEMAEGMSPFDLRVQELIEEGLSWQEAWTIASEEFGQRAEGESDQGIASII